MDDPRVGMRLGFLGGAGTVTGSRYLVEAGGRRLLVDCGLFQGYKVLRLRNRAPFPVEPASINSVLLTHAHLDHSGYLPRLVKEGFAGPVWCAPGTEALCRILWPDAASLQEEEAEFANRHGTSRHQPALPLFTRADVNHALRQLHEVPFDEAFEAAPGVVARFRPQGHILGAASVTLAHAGKRIFFSGDVGRPDDAVMCPPAPPPAADWIVCESTYGDRRHGDEDLASELASVLSRVLARRGVAIIPSFSVGRTQLLLHLVTKLQADGTIPKVPVYLNSPMATDVTALYGRYRDQHRLGPAELAAMHASTRFVNSVEESKALNRRKGPMVIVSASGMLTGGRVLHHIVAFGADPRNAIVISGFQAGGTRGAALVAGERTLRIHRQDVPINAEVVQLQSASAHADADELIAWLRGAPEAPQRVFLTHGEPGASDALRLRVERELGWAACVPDHLQQETL